MLFLVCPRVNFQNLSVGFSRGSLRLAQVAFGLNERWPGGNIGDGLHSGEQNESIERSCERYAKVTRRWGGPSLALGGVSLYAQLATPRGPARCAAAFSGSGGVMRPAQLDGQQTHPSCSPFGAKSVQLRTKQSSRPCLNRARCPTIVRRLLLGPDRGREGGLGDRPGPAVLGRRGRADSTISGEHEERG